MLAGMSPTLQTWEFHKDRIIIEGGRDMGISSWQAESITTKVEKPTPPPPPRGDQDVRDFLEAHCGALVILSEDGLFIKTMRAGVLRALQIKRDCVGAFRDPATALSGIRDQARANVPVLILVDRILAGKPTTEFIRTVKTQYPLLKLIVLTYETTKDSLSLLFEIGADHVVTKPVSVDTLIEKMAGVIKPQSKISQLVQNARVHLEHGEFDKVFGLCEAILAMKQQSPIALMLRGEAFMKNGNKEEAIEEFEKAHKASPLYLEPLKKLADVHRDGNVEQFLTYMLRLDSISPLNVERKCEIGNCYIRKHEPDNAKEFFDKAIACAQEEAKRYLCTIISDMAHAMLEVSPEQSEKYFSQYLDAKGDELSKDDIVAFNSRGIAMRKQGKWREAVENYETALKIDPEDLRLLYNYALAYADGEQHKKAIDLYERVLHKDPEFHLRAAVVSYNIANSYYHVKDIKNAKLYINTALEIDPDHASSKRLLVRIFEASPRNPVRV
jgi:tetratricopeptide (TPR) repeat protein